MLSAFSRLMTVLFCSCFGKLWSHASVLRVGSTARVILALINASGLLAVDLRAGFWFLETDQSKNRSSETHAMELHRTHRTASLIIPGSLYSAMHGFCPFIVSCMFHSRQESHQPFGSKDHVRLPTCRGSSLTIWLHQASFTRPIPSSDDDMV